MPLIVTQQEKLDRPHSTAPQTPTRFLGRQPILDERSRLFGYELLFRSGAHTSFSGDPEQATRDVVDHYLMLTPDNGEGFAFVNCTRQSLVEGIVTLLPPETTVLEILETIAPDDELIAVCRGLREQGYRFALDDFIPDPSRLPLLEFADFIKIDFRLSDAAERQQIYRMAGKKTRLLAEKIETEDEMRVARSEGCSLFQGYFFSQPIILSTKTVPRNQLVYLRLLTALNQEPVNFRDVEDLILSDASLCYRVLRLANSASHAHRGVINTVREALMLVGDHAVRKLVSIAVVSALGSHRSEALVTLALTRARFCERLAPLLQKPSQQLYLLGMLSLLDVLLATPMDRILPALPLPELMKAALLGENGPCSDLLALVRSLESCDWSRCESIRASMSLPESEVAAAWVEALRWASAAVPQG